MSKKEIKSSMEKAGVDAKREGSSSGDKKEGSSSGDKKEGCSSGDKKEGCSSGDKKEECSSGDKKEGSSSRDKKEGCSSGDKKEGNSSGDKKEGEPSTSGTAIRLHTLKRLASFLPPRDLSLTQKIVVAQKKPPVTKKVYVPNLNVTRRKELEPAPVVKAQEVKKPPEHEPKRKRFAYKRPPKRYLVGTEGIFSGDFPAPVSKRKSKAEKEKEESLKKPKFNLNAQIDQKVEEEKMKRLLKVDVDDDNIVLPDLTDLPLKLPMSANVTGGTIPDIEEAFKHIRFDSEDKEEPKNQEKDKTSKNAMLELFSDSSVPKLFAFNFPSCGFFNASDVPVKKKEEKKRGFNTEEEEEKKKRKPRTMDSFDEGRWGTLKIRANGEAYIEVGDLKLPISIIDDPSRKDVVVARVDEKTRQGEVVCLGNVEKSFLVSADFGLETSEKRDQTSKSGKIG